MDTRLESHISSMLEERAFFSKQDSSSRPVPGEKLVVTVKHAATPETSAAAIRFTGKDPTAVVS
jgi:hypothetical protein